MTGNRKVSSRRREHRQLCQEQLEDRRLLAIIAGYKFEDLDADGIEEVGEPRLNGIVFELNDGVNAPRLAVTQDIDLDLDGTINPATERGIYRFLDLPVGDYQVREIVPALFGQTTSFALETTTLVVENDADAIVAVPGLANDLSVNLETIEGVLAVGNAVEGSIHGFKFEDTNANGIFDSLDTNDDGIFEGLEFPQAGVTFTLTGTDGQGNFYNETVVTDANGEFWFENLFPSVAGQGQGTGYTIEETVPVGFVPTTPIRRTFDVFSRQELVWRDGAANIGDGVPLADQQNVQNASALVLGPTSVVEASPIGAQSFTAGLSGDLTQVDITISTTDVDADLTMEIQAIDLLTGAPNGQTLATATVMADDVPIGTEVTLTFDFGAAPARVLAGIQYGIVLNNPSAQSSIAWLSSLQDSYLGGTSFLGTSTGLPLTSRPGDASFTTFVRAVDPRVEVLLDDPEFGNGFGEELMFGNTVSSSIHGFKFEDLDADGSYDVFEGELPMAGVAFNLTGVDIQGNFVNRITNTDANGEFWFDGLLPSVPGQGQASGYTVTEIVPSGFIPTTGLTSRQFTLFPGIELVWQDGAANLPLDDPHDEFLADSNNDGIGDELIWGNASPGSIHGFKFIDANANGAFDQGEQPQANVQFVLTGTDAFGNVLNIPTFTDANGEFWYEQLSPSVMGQGLGTGYTVTEIVPAGFLPTTAVSRTFDLDSRVELVWANGRAMLPPVPQPQVDQQQQLRDTTMFVGQGQFGAQSFVPGFTGSLTQVDILVDVADSTTVGDVTMEIQTIDTLTGQPSGDVLASATVLAANVPVGQSQTLSFDFSGSLPTLIGGFQYALVLQSTDTLINIDWLATANNSYLSGVNYLSGHQGADWVTLQGDAVFTTTMRPEIDPRVEVLADSTDDGVGDELVWGNREPRGQIHGYKFEDANNNGSADPGEQRLQNWQIQLLDVNGVFITSVLTDANGEYWFTELDPGTYFVREVQQDGWVQTTHNPPAFTILGGEVYVSQLGQGMLDPEDSRTEILEKCLIFGNRLTSSIHGYKFNDLNGDGADNAEPRLAGVEIRLTGDVDGDGDSDQLVALTDVNGQYWFEDLVPGTYTITETVPEGSVATRTLPVTVTVAAGEEVAAVQGQSMLGADQFETVNPQLAIGNSYYAAIHGYKFLDSNRNGVDNAEPRLAGVTITLQGTDGLGRAVNRVTQTNANGLYWFVDLFPGNYTVSETPPQGSQPTTNLSTNVTLSSGQVAVAAFGLGSSMGSLGPGQMEADPIPGLAFGNFYPGEIHGHKYEDRDGDGVEDLGEPRLNGWTIVLTDQQGNSVTDVFGAIVQPVVTASMDLDGNGTISASETGLYWFTNLVPGTYVVREVQQNGFLQTSHDPAPVTITGAQVYVAQRDQVGTFDNDPREIIVDKCLSFGNQIRGEISWRKEDKHGELLGGVIFALTQTHSFDPTTGVYTDIVDVPTTVQDNLAPDIDNRFGLFSVINLPLGRYTLQETFPVPGYDPDTFVETFEVTNTNPFHDATHVWVNSWSKRAFVGSNYAARVAYLESIGLVLNPQTTAAVGNSVMVSAGVGSVPLPLLSNDFQREGSSELSIVGVGTPSMGGTAELINGMVYYTPAFTFASRLVETFTYTVSDGVTEDTAMVTTFSEGMDVRLDVNRDNVLSPLDALLVINQLDRPSSVALTGDDQLAMLSADTNGDSHVTPTDALLVINAINNRVSVQSPVTPAMVLSSPGLDSREDDSDDESVFDLVFGEFGDGSTHL